MPKYILFAGVNGAGKSTLYTSINNVIHDMPRINTDEIIRSFGNWQNMGDVMRAGKIATKQIENCFSRLESFNQETTLCGKSILRNIKTARSLGYRIELYYVGVDSVEIAKQRIAYRVSHGGHGIPDKDVERRYEESFRNLKAVFSFCDRIVIYDNTVKLRNIAIYEDHREIYLSEEIPDWFRVNDFC